MASKHLAVLLLGVCFCNLSIQSQPPFFSLQPAVEALAEREAQLALRNEIENGNIDDFVDSDDFEWREDYENSEREPFLQLPNRGQSRYSSPYNPDYEDFYSDYRKRALLRKRDSSVFRERSRGSNLQRQQQHALAEKFLRAIEDERLREEEEERKKQLRNLWNRYQLEEGDIEKELFDNDIDSDYDDSKRKRQNVGDAEVAPPYWNKKRTMPLLPWLPASRKKRFPVAKRSPKVNNELIVATENNDKVSSDLQGIFGKNEKGNGVESSVSMKKKRSSEETHPLVVEADKKRDMRVLEGKQSHEGHHKKKRQAEDPEDGEEPDNENDNDEEADPETDDGADEEDSEEDESKKKKKKREAPKEARGVSEADKKQKVTKRSLQWSNIFGIDRKKKSSGLIFHPLEDKSKRRKRCDDDEEDCGVDDSEEEGEDEGEDKKKRKRSSGTKLDEMDQKLRTIENLIIDETLKYYQSHDGSISPSKTRALRNLERMRKTIARFKQSMEYQNYLEKNLLAAAQPESDDDDKKKAKRVAVKKEKAEFDNNDHDMEAPAKKALDEPKKNDLGEDGDKKKKKKRSQKRNELDNFITNETPMSEGYMGGSRSTHELQCPILDGIEKKCRGIDIMSGDIQQSLLDSCGAHQLCYLCGDSQLQCDYDYLNEAEEVCDRDLKCMVSARQALAVLRGLGGKRIGPRECVRNPCLNMALRELSY